MSEFMRGSQAAAVAAGLTLAIGANAEANGSPCPDPSRLQTVSERCGSFLMRKLHHSVYDDVSDSLAIATYQKMQPNLAVDGSLGPLTAKSILRGKGMHPANPDPRSRSEELYIDKSKQVMYSLTDGQVRHLFSIASGTEKPYIFKDKKGHVKHETADTPTGTYHITRTKGPNYKAPLGRMPYARFYDDVNGIAVHSGTVTTKGRLSHGCIHVENPTMKKYIVPYFHKGNTVKVVE